MGDQARQRKAYAFLRGHAQAGTTFRAEDLANDVGWKLKSAKAYISKQYASYLERQAPGVHGVIPEFRRVGWEEFRELVTQVRTPFASYERATYDAVVVYDFLMPLTREDKLRKSLDALFFRDTLQRRIEEVGLPALRRTIASELGENDEEYAARVIKFVDDRIGGFSVSHVSGRFRTGAIVSRQAAADLVARGEEYLMDETTAVVRFIIPCLSSKTSHGVDFDTASPTENRSSAIDLEVRQIRAIFLELFVEALVPTIRGEKLIWMLESTPSGQRVYELGLVPTKLRAAGGSAQDDEDDDDPDSDEAPTGT